MKSCGNIPDWRERLKREVIGDMRISRCCFSKDVGMGSRSHVLVELLVIILLTSFSDTGSKYLSFEGTVWGCGPFPGVFGKRSLIFSIFSLKNVPNEFARLRTLSWSGRDGTLVRWRILFKVDHNLRGSSLLAETRLL